MKRFLGRVDLYALEIYIVVVMLIIIAVAWRMSQ